MSSGQKAAFSFLTALILFAGFVFFAHTGLMAQIETKFYAQAKIEEKNSQLEKLGQSCNSYISEILTTIQTGDKAYLKSSAVRTYVHQNPSEKDAAERINLTAHLFDQLEDYGLDGMRLIEKNGRTLHYSSFDSDILKKVSLTTTYKLYPEVVKDLGELEPEMLLVNPDKPETKYLLDKQNNRIVISFPFYITDNTYFATLVCYFNAGDFERKLLNDQVIAAGDSLCLVVSDDMTEGGFVLGLPVDSRSEFYQPVLTSWKKEQKSGSGTANLERILQKQDGSYWLLMTIKQSEQFKVAAVYSSTFFELPHELECLIYICVFMTILLVVSLLFNIKRDYLTVIKSRIKKVQFGIINEYFENKEKIEWSQVARQLENRKAELSEEIKKTIGGNSKKYSSQVDAYLDASWEDIISILKAQNAAETQNVGGATIEQIRRVIEDVLKTSKLNVNVTSSAVQQVEEIEEAGAPEALEGLDEVEEVEEVEALDDVEEIGDAEPVEEIEEIGDAEPVEEIEEIEDAEAVEEIEEIGDAEPVEEIEEVEEVEEIGEAEPVEEIGEAGVPEALEGLEEVEEAEEIEELTSVDDIPNIEPAFFVSIENPDFYEDLVIGTEEPEEATVFQIDGFNFIVQEPKFLLGAAKVEEPAEVEEITAVEPAEDLEEIQEIDGAEEPAYFSMTAFGQNEQPVLELYGETDSEKDSDTIVEKNGVYSISENLHYTKVLLNKEFKALVDSVLQN